MNASEANRIAKEVSSKPDMTDIYNCVERSARSGETSTYYYGNINRHQLKKLINDGYKVTNSSDQRDGTSYTISWNISSSQQEELNR